MASTEVLLLSIPRAEAENPKPRIVHFWRKVNEGLQVQDEKTWCHVLTGATISRPLHNGLIVPVERFVVSDRVREMGHYPLSLLRLGLNLSHLRPPLRLAHREWTLLVMLGVDLGSRYP